LAEAVSVGDFSAEKLREAVERLRTLMVAPEETRHVPRILADAGVRFVIVESFPGSKVDGVCFWLSKAQPVIGMTIRFDRIDNFWFVLRHEIEHILQRHGQTGAIVDSELERVAGETPENEQPEDERIANAAATEFCVPRVELDDFIARVGPAFSRRRVEGFAALLQIHPGIVTGQLRRRLGRWDLFTNLLVKVRHIVTASTLTDGHGHIAPVLV
jgi:HTH-type transcriptional regulator/antitoxin HigA